MKPFPLFLFLSFLLIVSHYPQVLRTEEIMNEVFLLVRNDKLLAFSGLRNNWSEKDLRTGETVSQKYV